MAQHPPWDPGDVPLPSPGIPCQAFGDGDLSPGLSPARCDSRLLFIVGEEKSIPPSPGQLVAPRQLEPVRGGTRGLAGCAERSRLCGAAIWIP